MVLPTRSLAVQVHAVLHSLGAAAGVNVALAAAQEGVAAEAAKLVSHPSQPSSGPHVLVATPGRLMAHLQASTAASWGGSSGSVLSLQHLKFLVVDEADRLLRQDYHGWLPQVLDHIAAACNPAGEGSTSVHMQEASSAGSQLLALQQPASNPSWQLAGDVNNQMPESFSSSSMAGLRATTTTTSSSSNSSRVLKLVVSATLTRDPSKLMRLQLCCPRYIALTDVHRRYTLPAALQQYRLVVPAQHKPLALVGLLHRLGADARIVLFASSLDMTHR